ITSLALAIMAFNYKVYDDTSAKDLTNLNTSREEMLDVPITQQLPPPPMVQLEQPQIVEVPDTKKIEEDVKINMDIETHFDQVIAEAQVTEPVVEVEKEDPHQIFIVVEETA